MSGEYVMMVGLEVHAELLTATKMFCRCPTRFGDPPNTNVCPVCLGLPGALPQPNEEAVKLAVRAALALGCEVRLSSKFDRKNYFYPDLPKGYQISQYDEPLAVGGHVRITNPPKTIRIRRLHLEEDAGKSLHAGDDITKAAYSLVDFNRCGVPLIEIVSEPDIESSWEAKQYLEKLQRILAFARVSDVKMEEGSMRVDCNISVRRVGTEEVGTRCELKNLSSFRAVVRALDYEFARQKAILESGGEVTRETRHWDEVREVTVPLRAKELSEDYRYFPDPDLPRLELDPEFVDRIRESMPKLPDELEEYYVNELGLPKYDAGVLTQSPHLADFFDRCVALGGNPKSVANWIMGDLLGYMRAKGIPVEHIPITPEKLTSMIRLIQDGTISGKIAKEVLVAVIETGKQPDEVVKERGLRQVDDEGELARVVDQVIAENPKVVSEIRAGKEKAIGFLVGAVMRKTGGRANPAKVNVMLREKLFT